MLSEKKNVRLNSLFMIPLQLSFPKQNKATANAGEPQADPYADHHLRRAEYRASVRGTMRTPGGSWAIVQGLAGERISLLFFP